MKRMYSLLAAGLFLALTAVTAGAAQYPPGPSGTCLDSVTIMQVQDVADICHPASGDTIAGIAGVVTGFDKDFSPFNFWIQVRGAGPYRGVQVFTGSTNYFASVPGTPTGGNIALGDSVRISGRTNEFNGVTQVLDYDNSQTSNDIIIFRLATGVPQPAYYVGDPDQFNWVPALATNGEPYEGMLVKMLGPLVVGRIAGPGVGSRTMLVTSASFPGDTAAIDGFSLTNVAALPVTTVIDSVQGILTQTLINSIPSYRIQLRGPEDLFAAAPPNLVDGYAIEDNLIRLQFDRDLDPVTSQQASLYDLASFGTVNSATLEGGSGTFVVLNITNGLNDGDTETVTAKAGIKSSSGVAMPSPQTRTFANGVMRLADVQSPDPAALAGAPCYDRSRFTSPTGGNGIRISYRGTVVAVLGNVYYLQEELNNTDSLRTALPVFAPPAPLTVGNRYLIAGTVQEFNGISAATLGGLTEGTSSVYAKDEGAGTIPTPRVQTVSVLADSSCDPTRTLTTAEDYEGMLVRIPYVRVAEERLPGESFFVADLASPDTILITNSSNTYAFDPDSAHTVTVTGVLTYRTGTRAFRIHPRSDADIIDHGLNVGVGGGGNLQALRFAVFPNPSRSPRLSFTLPQASNVEIAAYDVAGRKVAEVFRGYLPAGQYARDWNGATTGGGRLGAGLYFLRLRSAGKEVVARSVLLQ